MPKSLDIHAILSEEERIPVKFKRAARGMNHLNPNYDTNNMDDNDEDELPEVTHSLTLTHSGNEGGDATVVGTQFAQG